MVSGLSQRPSRRSLYSRHHILGAFLLGCCVSSLIWTIIHFYHIDSFHATGNSSLSTHLQSAKLRNHVQVSVKKNEKESMNSKSSDGSGEKKRMAANHDNVVHPVAGLRCEEHGGPSPKDAQEMVYWRDIPEDNGWTSPFRNQNVRQYLTFVPDAGGWYVKRPLIGVCFCTVAFEFSRRLLTTTASCVFVCFSRNNIRMRCV